MGPCGALWDGALWGPVGPCRPSESSVISSGAGLCSLFEQVGAGLHTRLLLNVSLLASVGIPKSSLHRPSIRKERLRKGGSSYIWRSSITYVLYNKYTMGTHRNIGTISHTACLL